MSEILNTRQEVANVAEDAFKAIRGDHLHDLSIRVLDSYISQLTELVDEVGTPDLRTANEDLKYVREVFLSEFDDYTLRRLFRDGSCTRLEVQN